MRKASNLEKLEITDLDSEAFPLAESLEARLKGLFKKDENEKACAFIFESAPQVLDLTRKFVPEQALSELRAMKRCNWPGGSGTYHGDADYKRKSKYREKRWADETGVLEASHPKRVGKLWEASKEKFEIRYHRSFKSRKDLAAMFGIVNKRNGVEREIEELRKSLSIWNKFKAFAAEEPEAGWAEAGKMWEEQVVSAESRTCASSLVGLVKDMARPAKMFVTTYYQTDENGKHQEHEEEAPLTYGSIHGHHVEFPNIWTRKHIYQWQAMHLATTFVEDKKGTLSFARAINMLYPESAKAAEMEQKRMHIDSWEIPQEVVDVLNKTLKTKYENRQPGDEASRFMKWYSERILDRWKATAVDHDRLFDYHDPHFLDKRLMSVFWRIREGKDFDQYSKEHFHRRLPGVLKAMLEDKVLTPEQINPSLKEKYLTHTEVISSMSSRALPDSRNSLISLIMEKEPATIAISRQEAQMPLLLEGPKSPRQLQNDLTPLAEVLDPSKKYFALFKGKHTIFLSSEEHYPSGSQAIGSIYRLSLLPEGIDPKEGSVVVLGGQRFNVAKQRSYRIKEEMSEAIFDSKSDAVPLNSFTTVVDVSPQEFREKYFKDFMAHVLIHRPSLGLEDLLGDLEQIDTLETTGLNLQMGSTGRTRLRTFDLGGRFGFQVKNEKNAMWDEVPFISKTLIDYIKGVGLPVHTEIDLDESGRETIRRKSEDREFYREHFQEIVDSLKGKGLPKLLSYIITDQKYSKRIFGEAREPCKDCGKKYINGQVYRPDLREQWCEGFWAGDLHDLTEHPHTFRFKFDNLRKIHRTIQEAKEYTPPFFEHPEIMPEFREFARAYQNYVHASFEGYSFWEDTQGGIRAEEEQLEEDPELKKRRDEEIEINKREWNTEKTAWQAAVKLQEKYDSLRGKKIDPNQDIRNVTGYWADQMMIYGVYQTTAPKLLPFSGNAEPEEDIFKLHRAF